MDKARKRDLLIRIVLHTLLILLVCSFHSVSSAGNAPASAKRPPQKRILPQEDQSTRNARVTGIRISPGDSVAQVGGVVTFVAIPFDSDQNPVPGVAVTWGAKDARTNHDTPISKTGDFTAREPGVFTITAAGAGQQAQATLTVTQVQNSNAALTVRDGAGWTSDNVAAAFAPVNRRGDPPNQPHDGGAGSSNFKFTAPLLSLPGRGLDIGLALTYNSLVWGSSPDYMIFDPDGDWPAPGWSLGYGKLVLVGSQGFLIDSDGTRHSYSCAPPNVAYTTCHTTDNTLIDYQISPPTDPQTARAQYPNGTIIQYAALGRGALYPIKITDRNGNFFTITYRSNVGPSIEVIRDTVGRTITFAYDANNLLIAIIAPAVSNGSRVLARLHYRRLSLDAEFGGAAGDVIMPKNTWAIDGILYPATSSGYWFADSDSYSSYGMLAKISEQRAMAFEGSLSEQGTITQGRLSRQRVYDYPLSPAFLEEAPRYTSLVDTWDSMSTEPAKTVFAVYKNQGRTEITGPDGSKHVYLSYHNHLQQTSLLCTGTREAISDEGLQYREELYDANGRLVSASTTTWERGEYDSPRPSCNVKTDELNQSVSTQFAYGAYNQITDVALYDAVTPSPAPLRRTLTEYQHGGNYTARHIFTLPKSVDTFGTAPSTTAVRLARTEYVYDGQPLAAAPDVVQHDDTWNPFASRTWVPPHCDTVCDPKQKPECQKTCVEGEWVTDYDPSTDFRGNITSITRYVDAVTPANPVTEVRGYDITGNLINVSGTCCQSNAFIYTSATQYSYPTTIITGAMDPNSSARRITSATVDVSTGLVTSSTDPSGRTFTMSYDPGSLRPFVLTSPAGGSQTYSYDDASMAITKVTKTADNAVAATLVNRFDGLGKVRRAEDLSAADTWDVIETQYDALGRIWHQTLPFRVGDQTASNEITYDTLGRVVGVREPDGSLTQWFYDEATRPSRASSDPGQTVRVRDGSGRERWERTDALGHLVEVVEPNPDANGAVAEPGHLLTRYTYDALGHLLDATQGSQGRYFQYDSLGRITHQKLSEQAASLTDSGTYVAGSGIWSDVFTYDAHSNMISHTDARGVTAVFHYDGDPLDRLQAVTYDTKGFGDTDHPIVPAPGVSYSYMSSGDPVRVSSVATIGISTDQYLYYDFGLLKSRVQLLSGHEGAPLSVDYIYDSLDRVTDIVYPAQYGTLGSERKVVHQSYGPSSRSDRLQVNGVDYASGFVYSAAGQLSSLNVGNDPKAPTTETSDFDQANGLLRRQSVQRGNETLLDLEYNYLRTFSGDALTNILDHVTPSRGRSYGYDMLSRLTSVSEVSVSAQRWVQRYSFDSYGNRTGVTISGQQPESSPARDGLDGVSYDAYSNRITTPGFSYDAAGNQTRAWGGNGFWMRFQYDAAGRVARVTDDNNIAGEVYLYGPSNRRVATQLGDASTARRVYLWDGSHIIAEYAESDLGKRARVRGTLPRRLAWVKSYVYLGGRLLATLEPSADGELVQYHHPDRTGTRLITGPGETDVEEQVTLPFGVALDSESTGASPRRFTSYDRSTINGLDYAVNRYYDPQQGRFTQTDPSGTAAADLSDPQTLNTYAYVRNNPVNLIDPLGLDWCEGGYCETITVVGTPVAESSDSPSPGGLGPRSPEGPPGGGGGGGGGGRGGTLDKIRKAVCSAIPSGRVAGISGAVGLQASGVAGLEMVLNYNSGQVSGFAFGGAQVGWNNLASVSAYTGFLYGLDDSNSNYKGGFTAVSGGYGLFGIFAESSSAGLSPNSGSVIPNIVRTLQRPDGDVVGVGGSIGASPGYLFGGSGGVSITNYTPPLQFGSIPTLEPLGSLYDQIVDTSLYVAKQFCKASAK